MIGILNFSEKRQEVHNFGKTTAANKSAIGYVIQKCAGFGATHESNIVHLGGQKSLV